MRKIYTKEQKMIKVKKKIHQRTNNISCKILYMT